MREFATADAVVFEGHPWSYQQLLGLVDRWRLSLAQAGVQPGDVVAIDTRSLPFASAGVVALAGVGAVVVPIGPVPPAKRDEFLDVGQVEVIVELGDGQTPAIRRTGRRAKHELYDRLRRTGRPGVVLFSSGTTGRSKGSVLDLDKLLERYREPGRSRRTYSFLGLDHIGGLNTLLHTFSNGGAVVATSQRTPDAVFETIARDRVQVLPTTPTFLNMVLISRAYERHATDALELVTYGTEPMPQHTLSRIKAALPHVRLKQTYGLSELGILPTRSKTDDSLWLQLGERGFAHKVVDGILWVRSDMAMLGYLNAPWAFDDEGFFNTQDVVEVDGDYLRILGRRSEVINVGGEKVYPAEVEDVLLEVPNIAAATVAGQPSPVTGMVVAATLWLVRPEDARDVSRRIREYCRGRLEPHKVPAVMKLSEAPAHSERFKKIRRPT
jgi:acyl-CoA synthetase (AMP-forming)/AMP-acid ligase II